MSKDDIKEIIEFYRDGSDGRSVCQVVIFYGNSAVVEDEDGMTVFEFTPDAGELAIKCVEAKGYIRCDEP